MTIEQGLVTELRADAGVSAIVGTSIYPNAVPQGASLPCIVYSRVSAVRETDMNGPQQFTRVRLQVDCWHTSYSGVKALADAVRSALNGVGVASPHTLGGESVQLVMLDTDQDLSEFDGDDRDYRVSQDWIITHLET